LVSSLEQPFSDAENSPAWLKERSQPYSKQRMRESTGKEHAFALRSNSSQGEAGALGFLCNPVFVCSCFAKRNELVAFSNLEIGRPLGHLVNPHNANASKSKPTQPIKPVVAPSVSPRAHEGSQPPPARMRSAHDGLLLALPDPVGSPPRN